MSKMNWSRARAWRPSEQAFPVDRLGRAARDTERSWAWGKPKKKKRAVLLSIDGGRAGSAADSGAPVAHFDAEEIRARLAGVPLAQVHCDGSASPNPGRAGFAAIVETLSGAIEIAGSVEHSTNNRCELFGAIHALELLPAGCYCTINSDAKYLIDGMTKWIEGWRRKGFKRGGAPMPNADLWQKLSDLTTGRTVHWNWVRGHAGHSGNMRADRLATEARELGQRGRSP